MTVKSKLNQMPRWKRVTLGIAAGAIAFGGVGGGALAAVNYGAHRQQVAVTRELEDAMYGPGGVEGWEQQQQEAPAPQQEAPVPRLDAIQEYKDLLTRAGARFTDGSTDINGEIYVSGQWDNGVLITIRGGAPSVEWQEEAAIGGSHALVLGDGWHAELTATTEGWEGAATEPAAVAQKIGGTVWTPGAPAGTGIENEYGGGTDEIAQ